MSESNLVGFMTWNDVLKHVKDGHRVYYNAPMNQRPRLIPAKIKGRKIRVGDKTTKRDFDPFDADNGHLDRFFKKA